MGIKKNTIAVIIALGLCAGACSGSGNPGNTIFQVSTIDALLSGLFDGSVPLQELKKQGNFGIGTFHALDGEMVMLNGSLYQIKADGKVYTPETSTTTPFATVCNFRADGKGLILPDTTFITFATMFDKAYPNKNLFYAIIIKGTFTTMKTRSVPRQVKPYPALIEVTKHQPEFVMNNVSGTIVGFRCPDYVKGINVPGYHLHFISDDRSSGGHVLSFELKEGTYETDIIDHYTMVLPSGSAVFARTNLSRDRSAELQKVEK